MGCAAVCDVINDCLFLSYAAELGDSASIDTTITQVVDQFNRSVFIL